MLISFMVKILFRAKHVVIFNSLIYLLIDFFKNREFGSLNYYFSFDLIKKNKKYQMNTKNLIKFFSKRIVLLILSHILIYSV